MDEFPFGANIDGIDLMELEQEMEDLLANDESIYEDNEVEGRMMAPMKNAAPEIASAVVFFASAASLPFLCVGLFRHVYLTKCIVLLLSSIIKVIHYFVTTVGDMDGRAQVVKGVADPEPEESAKSINRKAQAFGFSFAFRTSSSLDEILSFFLFYELYQCTCHMEARTQSVSRFAQKMLLAFLLSSSLNGLQSLSVLIFDLWWSLFLNILDPAALLLNLACTGAVIYLGIQIFSALRKSDEFRKTNSQKDGKTSGKTNHLTLVVVFLIVAQVVKFFLRLVGLIVLPIYLNKMIDCNTDLSMKENAYLEERRCDSFSSLMSLLFSYLTTKFANALEIVFVIALMARKKYNASRET